MLQTACRHLLDAMQEFVDKKDNNENDRKTVNAYLQRNCFYLAYKCNDFNRLAACCLHFVPIMKRFVCLKAKRKTSPFPQSTVGRCRYRHLARDTRASERSQRLHVGKCTRSPEYERLTAKQSAVRPGSVRVNNAALRNIHFALPLDRAAVSSNQHVTLSSSTCTIIAQ